MGLFALLYDGLKYKKLITVKFKVTVMVDLAETLSCGPDLPQLRSIRATEVQQKKAKR
uniref:Uncharacterized protein n=1 Tax=Tetranychus urticae TaxID=32264 RepID=T1JWR6_TETUR